MRRSAKPNLRVRRPPQAGAWAVIGIDSAPIRDAARREYEKARKELQKAREELDRFNNRDKPLHGQWVARIFGARLTELRELHAKLLALRELVERVQAEYMFGGHRTVYQAFRAVKQEEERQSREPDDAGEPGFESEEWEPDAEERKHRKKVEDEARQFISDMFGFDPGDFLSDPEALEDDPFETRADARLKELYRAIVRRLHPDAGGERTAAQMELWHQTQQAYEERDLDQLEVILATLEVEENGAASSSVSVLRKIVAQFKSGVRSVKSLLRQAKHDPAWNFSRLEERSALERRMEILFEQDKRAMVQEIIQLEMQTREWEQGGRRGARGRGRRGRGREKAENVPF